MGLFNEKEETVFTRNTEGDVSIEVNAQNKKMTPKEEFNFHKKNAEFNNPASLLYLGDFYANSGQKDLALHYYKTTTAHTEESLNRYFNLVDSLDMNRVTIIYLINLIFIKFQPALDKLRKMALANGLSFYNIEEQKQLYKIIYNKDVKDLNEPLADILFKERDYEKAMVLYEEVISKGILVNYQNIADLNYLYVQPLDPVKAKTYYEKCNNAYSELRLGEIYEFGVGVNKNLKKAYKHYNQSISLGGKMAKRNLLPILYEGKYKDEELLFKYSNEIAPLDNIGYFYLGLCYEESLGTNKDVEEAFVNYNKCNMSNELVIKKLGDCYCNGIGCEVNYTKAYEFYSKLPYNNEVELDLLNCYLKIDVIKHEEIVTLLKKVVKKIENPDYYCALAKYYLEGKYTEENKMLAYDLLLKATNFNHAESFYVLGNQYIEENPDKGLEYYHKAADYGSEDAMLYLFKHYYKLERHFLAYNYASKIVNIEDDELFGFLNSKVLDTIVEVDLEKKFLSTLKLEKRNDPMINKYLGDFYHHGIVINSNYSESIKYYRLNEDSKDGWSLYSLAYYLENGMECSKSIQQAIKYLKKAIELGSTNANLTLAAYYQKSSNGEDYDKEAFKKYEELSKKNGYALFKLGLCYENGNGCEANVTKAINCYNQALDKGELYVSVYLGNLYETGKVVKQDLAKAFTFYKRNAKFDKDSQFELGRCYEEGIHVKQDVGLAIEYYTLAAKQNHVKAPEKLGEIYYFNKEFRDYDKAYFNFHKAKNLSNVLSYYDIGNCFYFGRGVKRNPKRAFENYGRGYILKDKRAAYGLGNCYFYGRGVAQNYDKAFEMYKIASDANVKEAFGKLGLCYERGLGVTKDLVKAVKFFEHSVDTSIDAKYKLGLYYYNGVYITKDLVKAEELLLEAANMHHTGAMVALADYYKNEKNLFVKAFNLYEMAYKLGSTIGKIEYAYCLYNGQGTPQDQRLGCEFFDDLEFLGDVEAKYLQAMYLKKTMKNPNVIEKVIECLEVGASVGYEKSVLELANLYFDGRYVTKNYKLAFKYYKMLEDDIDNKLISQRLIYFYKDGIYCERDIEKVYKIYEKIANFKDSESRNFLGEYYLELGKYNDAFKVFSTLNDGEGKFHVAYCQLYGLGTKVDVKGALKKLFTLEKAGCHKAMNLLGVYYSSQMFNAIDYEKAYSCYEEAAKLGNKNALVKLAEFNLLGTHNKTNPQEAFNILSKGLLNLNKYAVYELASYYEKGITVNKDFNESIRLLKLASDLGYDMADYKLAVYYYNGSKLDKNYRRAFEHFVKSAKAGNTKALSKVAVCYYTGRGVETDFNKAVELFNKSINVAESKYFLAECYENGYTGEVDTKKAFKFYLEASKSNELKTMLILFIFLSITCSFISFRILRSV